jgi:hypothetical protein
MLKLTKVGDKSYVDHSRFLIQSADPERDLTHVDIQVGCLQRIAAALELATDPIEKVMIEKNKLGRQVQRLEAEILEIRKSVPDVEHLERRIASLKGVITRMKRKG